jgi:hypothetical protein
VVSWLIAPLEIAMLTLRTSNLVMVVLLQICCCFLPAARSDELPASRSQKQIFLPSDCDTSFGGDGKLSPAMINFGPIEASETIKVTPELMHEIVAAKMRLGQRVTHAHFWKCIFEAGALSILPLKDLTTLTMVRCSFSDSWLFELKAAQNLEMLEIGTRGIDPPSPDVQAGSPETVGRVLPNLRRMQFNASKYKRDPNSNNGLWLKE